jgi:4-alpha-glucanotransferase
MGDLPIYVARDSADLWSQPHLFDLGPNFEPRYVAGVPPDYFSKDGQLWGNPLYDWRRMAREGFRWWKQRVRANLAQADLVRLDHFRGFAGFWQVRSGERTARNGSWQPGPGPALFAALLKDLGRLPLVAEDLGEITPDVDQLRDAFGLPGMKVLQFGFGHEPNGHTPHNVGKKTVVYTGTHDNDTAAGWMRKLPKEDRERFRSYTGAGAKEPAWTLIRAAYTTAAEIALVPVQDVLGLGNSARMNTPGKSRGNWAWRLAPGVLRKEHADRLRRLAEVSERIPK